MTTVMVLALVALGLVGLFMLLSTPTRGALSGGGAPALPAGASALPAAIRAQYGGFLPGSEAILGAPPAVPVEPLLQQMPAVAPPVADLSVLGVAEERDAVDRELWRAWRARARAQARRPS